MNKPRHHTLQGICQDVCVSYQQVVEVHRRIRDVVLSENGKVITQNLGTFFCRDVRPRVGVLNGTPWSTDGFFEVGLKGERTERSEAHDVGDVERVSFVIGSGFLGDGVLGDLLANRPLASLEFQDTGIIVGTRRPNPPLPIGQDFSLVTEQVSAEGLVAGFNNVTFEITEEDNPTVFPLDNLLRLQLAGQVLLVNGVGVGLGESIDVDVSEVLEIGYNTTIPGSTSGVQSFNFRISHTFFDPGAV